MSAATVKKLGSNVGWAKAVSTAKGEEAVWGVVAEMGERWQHSNANEERGRMALGVRIRAAAVIGGKGTPQRGQTEENGENAHQSTEL